MVRYKISFLVETDADPSSIMDGAAEAGRDLLEHLRAETGEHVCLLESDTSVQEEKASPYRAEEPILRKGPERI